MEHMSQLATVSRLPHRLSCTSVEPARLVPSLADDVRLGLLKQPRSLPPKYFYDHRGSQLFERICRTSEYYPTRTEAALLRQCADNIIAEMCPDHIVELGSGSSSKTRHLLDACSRAHQYCSYWPFDVCEEMLIDSGTGLEIDYPWLEICALVGDYHGGIGHLPLPEEGSRLYVFLGGTIGNFAEREAAAFVSEIAGSMRPGDALLLGADRVKDSAVLTAAYNDAAGITADFNRNLLSVLNHELRADFRPEQFRHEAVYNEDEARIEMRLYSMVSQQVRLGTLNTQIEFSVDDPILTEISRKFTMESLNKLVTGAGLDISAHYEAANAYYSLVLAKLPA